ncbi:MAG: hypothetical protein CMI54_08635 [Parcubacteria group bacterium]|jgi:hypothetical protein|nr:hypothetical protein [Parcubacteria group bacterium]|tara:strand:- start:1715 stop:1927 length:213 start_codon:yes stop_codon:yes gene_type:complete
MDKQVLKMPLICVEIHESKFRWFWDKVEAMKFAKTLYNADMLIMNEPPIYEHDLELSPESVCKFLNEREM